MPKRQYGRLESLGYCCLSCRHWWSWTWFLQLVRLCWRTLAKSCPAVVRTEVCLALASKLSRGFGDTRQQCKDNQKETGDRAFEIRTDREKGVMSWRDWTGCTLSGMSLDSIKPLGRNHSIFWCLCLCSGVVTLADELSSLAGSTAPPHSYMA